MEDLIRVQPLTFDSLGDMVKYFVVAAWPEGYWNGLGSQEQPTCHMCSCKYQSVCLIALLLWFILIGS